MSNFFREINKKNIYVYGLIIIFSIVITLTFFIFRDIYLNEKNEKINIGTINSIVPNNNLIENNVLDEVSSSLDNNIENVKNQTVNTIIKNKENHVSTETSSIAKEQNNVKENIVDKKEENIKNVESTTVDKEFKLLAPVDGEISKDFADETLLYSDTLKEWTTHMGIDIKAEKTTIVKSAYNGIVESIKNDPRYGLTITIDHENGFKTVYSNLLTSEFVNEGERVEEGKTIGTVGESASFESLEEPHLHFEVLKDNINVNPTLYLK